MVLMLYDWKKEEDFPRQNVLYYIVDTMSTPLFKRITYCVLAFTMLMWLLRDVFGI